MQGVGVGGVPRRGGLGGWMGGGGEWRSDMGLVLSELLSLRLCVCLSLSPPSSPTFYCVYIYILVIEN